MMSWAPPMPGQNRRKEGRECFHGTGSRQERRWKQGTLALVALGGLGLGRNLRARLSLVRGGIDGDEYVGMGPTLENVFLVVVSRRSCWDCLFDVSNLPPAASN